MPRGGGFAAPLPLCPGQGFPTEALLGTAAGATRRNAGVSEGREWELLLPPVSA